MCYLHFVARLNCASQRATPAYAERAFVAFKFGIFKKICQSIKHNGALNQIETFTIKIRITERGNERARAPRVARSIKTIFIARIDFYCLSLMYECISHFSDTATHRDRHISKGESRLSRLQLPKLCQSLGLRERLSVIRVGNFGGNYKARNRKGSSCHAATPTCTGN